MIQTSDGRQRSAFLWWLRTGKRPPALSPDGLELKFNPWHDPTDGRFTFAGAGRRFGAGGSDTANGASSRASGRVGRAPSIGDRNRSRTATPPKAEAPRVGRSAGSGRPTAGRGPSRVLPSHAPVSRPGDRPNPVAEYLGGAGQHLYDAGHEAVTGIYAALTTNPATTVRNAGRGIAGMIDTAIAAEDTPARIQVSRAADAVANASARDLGRATASVASNVVLAFAPGAALSRFSAMQRLRTATPRTTYDPPQIGWVKETIRSEEPWKAYNDSAAGSRPGLAPTLTRTMPDGSKRPVKFDGIQGDYVIDRKWSVRDAARARAQILRQAEVLAQHRLIGVWEVPTSVQKVKALKMFKKLNVSNIKVKVVKP